MNCLRKRRKELGLTMLEVAKAVGVSEATVSRYESGDIKNMRRDRIEKYAKVLKVSPALIIGLEPEDQNPEPNAVILPQKKIRMVPVFESVAAGMGAYADDRIVDYMPCFIQNDREAENTICVNVCGNSMYPKIEDGDVIQVLKQDWAENGQIAVVLIDGEEAVVKKIEYTANTVTLISLNPEWAPRIFTGTDREQLKILGVVKKVIKDV